MASTYWRSIGFFFFYIIGYGWLIRIKQRIHVSDMAQPITKPFSRPNCGRATPRPRLRSRDARPTVKRSRDARPTPAARRRRSCSPATSTAPAQPEATCGACAGAPALPRRLKPRGYDARPPARRPPAAGTVPARRRRARPLLSRGTTLVSRGGALLSLLLFFSPIQIP